MDKANEKIYQKENPGVSSVSSTPHRKNLRPCQGYARLFLISQEKLTDGADEDEIGGGEQDSCAEGDHDT